MNSLLRDAESILDTALRAGGASNVAILVSAEGGIRIVLDPDWPLESLAWHHGAEAAYRVTTQDGRISVEGRSLSRRCTLEAESPQVSAQRLLGGVPRYLLASGA